MQMLLILSVKPRLCRPTHLFLNPLSQVGVLRINFEVPFRGHVSLNPISNSRETAIGSKQRRIETHIAGVENSVLLL